VDRLNGKKAIVTGAAAGIGRATALMLAREGADVLLTDIDGAGGAATCSDIAAAGRTAVFMEQDVSDETRWPAVIDGALSHFGSLDVLVNNAGIQISKPMADTTLDDWRRVFQINVEGVFLGTRHAMTIMKRSGSGSIINLSSTMAMVVNELNAAYCASKAAVTHFTKAAALDGAANGNRVRVNSIHPGVIATPMIEREIDDVAHKRGDATTDAVRRQWNTLCPLGMGEPDDIAYGVVYLASDESKYVTGSEMIIDGGHLIGRNRQSNSL